MCLVVVDVFAMRRQVQPSGGRKKELSNNGKLFVGMFRLERLKNFSFQNKSSITYSNNEQ